MSVDPADDCTFWYTNQYYSSPANGASGNWQTRIGSFKFPSCSAPSNLIPACTLTASPSTIDLGNSVNLTATCIPAAAYYAWTPATNLVAGAANTATVRPMAVGVHQYSVTGFNANGAGTTASTSVTVKSALVYSQSDCFLDWAERTYPSLFAPAGATSYSVAPYYYRYYRQTNAYLATSLADIHVYYLGALSNNSIVDAGALAGWLLTAGCL